MKYLFVAITILIAYTSCNNNKHTETAINSTVLPDSSLYNIDAVNSFLAQHKQANKEATNLFMQAIDQFRNKKDASSSVDLFKRSAAIHPNAKTYYELGNAFMTLRNYPYALRAFQMAEQLGFEPNSKLLYNTACTYSLLGKTDEAAKYIEYAVEAGYSNIDQIQKDPDLEFVRNTNVFQIAYHNAMTGASDPETILWQMFKREFKTIALPVTLNLETQKQFSDNSMISYDFEKFVSEMRDAKFSRDIGKEFYYYTAIEDNSKYTAMIYAVQDAIDGDNAPWGYVLISFNNKGVLIDKMEVGGQMQLADLYKVCTIQPNLHFEIKEYKNNYTKDVEKEGYDNNPIASTELKTTKNYRIDDNGKFVQTDALTMNYRR